MPAGYGCKSAWGTAQRIQPRYQLLPLLSVIQAVVQFLPHHAWQAGDFSISDDVHRSDSVGFGRIERVAHLPGELSHRGFDFRMLVHVSHQRFQPDDAADISCPRLARRLPTTRIPICYCLRHQGTRKIFGSNRATILSQIEARSALYY